MGGYSQDGLFYRLLEAALPVGNNIVAFQIDMDSRVIRARRGDLPLDAVEKIWVRGSRRRRLFGYSIVYNIVIFGLGRSYDVMRIRTPAEIDAFLAELAVAAPIERYDVRDSSPGPI